MQPYYWQSTHGNFGDDLNLWLWDFLLPGLRDVHADLLLVGVGTVLNTDLLPAGGRKLVIGSGFGYGAAPDLSDRNEWDVRALRGPLTAKKMGFPAELGIVDPAVMVTDMPEFQGLARIGGPIFVPHWESAAAGLWQLVCEQAGLAYVDPRGEAKSVIRAIAQAELVVAESMHAAILADAFRVPWVAVSTSRAINSFKWQDWSTSLGVSYAPRHVPISTRAEAISKSASFWGVKFNRKDEDPIEPPARQAGTAVIDAPSGSRLRNAAKLALATPSILALRQARRAQPQLSADATLRQRKQRLYDVLGQVRRDYWE